MKKIEAIFLAILISMLFIGLSFAANISQKDKKAMDDAMSMIEKQWGKDPIVTQISNYEMFVKALSAVKIKPEQKESIKYLNDLLKNKLNELKKQITTQNQIISNVDRDRVKTEWLSWHNQERWDLTPYTYNESLNYTALLRAQQIAKETRKTWNTHARKLGDWYWNTESIKERFSNLWVNVLYFSESNAYGYYNCKKSDCTQEMIDVLKKCFDRTLMDWTHRPAVISKIYDQIWFWVAVNWNYVWVTTHYAKGVK